MKKDPQGDELGGLIMQVCGGQVGLPVGARRVLDSFSVPYVFGRDLVAAGFTRRLYSSLARAG